MGEPQFIIAQVFGVFGMIAMLISFQMNRKHNLLWMQILSCIFYIGQYLCLGAFSGCMMNFLAMIRNFTYSRFKKTPRYLIGVFVLATVIISFFTFSGPISLLPCLATLVFTIGLSSKNMTLVRLADLVACALYLVYNLNVEAYTGAVATVLEATSTLIAMARFDKHKIKSTITIASSKIPKKPRDNH